METNNNKAYGFALVAILLWSTVATAFKIALQSLNYLQLLFIASLTATVVLFLVLLFQKKTPLLLKISTRGLLFSAIGGCLCRFF